MLTLDLAQGSDCLQQLLPGIRIDISASISETADFTRSDLDVMLVRGDGQWHGLHAERLFAEHLTPMCRPQMAPELQTPGDMQHQCLIHADASQQEWQRWWQQCGHGEMTGRHVVFDSLESATSAAVSGYGIAWSVPLPVGRIVLDNRGKIRWALQQWEEFMPLAPA